MPKEIKSILISRTDSIGDVMLTLPMCGYLKKHFPELKIIFLGKRYTKAVIDNCKHVGAFLDYDLFLEKGDGFAIQELQKLNVDSVIHVFPVKHIAFLCRKAKIKNRVGTSGRWYHYFTCNRIIPLSRKNSDLHEAQLNIKLLQFLNIPTTINIEEIPNYYGFDAPNKKLPEFCYSELKKVIFHMKSKGSAREWGLNNFSSLYRLLDKTQYQIYITGTADEEKLMGDFFIHHPEAINLCGKLSLTELCTFIKDSHALVAASTGPLHIASALGIRAIGLFAPMRPIHPGRWAPLGKKAEVLVLNKNCSDCRKGGACHCIASIDAKNVMKIISV